MAQSKLPQTTALSMLILFLLVSVKLAGQTGFGGLVGFNDQSIISGSYSRGDVRGDSSVGGLVGLNSGTVRNSYSRGDVTRITGEEENIGGFCGENDQGIIANSFSTGAVVYQGVEDPVNRGFCGYAGGDFTMSGNYWDTETSGQTATAGNATGRTTAQMTYPYAEDTYEDWDFEEVWFTDGGSSINDGYPSLRWQGAPYPNVAVNPNPADDSTAVPVALESLQWQYIADSLYTDPEGFRVYWGTSPDNLQQHGSFVFYEAGEQNYSLSMVHAPHLDFNTVYYWQVVPTADRNNANQDALNCPVWSFTTIFPTNVETIDELPVLTGLQRNYPNPFNPATTIGFSLAEAGEVLLEVYSIKGQKVATLIKGDLAAGNHQVIWNGRNDDNRQAGSGIYLYRLSAGSYQATKRMLLLQ